MILGCASFGISSLAQRVAGKQIELSIVHDKKESEKLKNQFYPEPIMFTKPPLFEENKIHYDKYGKPLENKGSKYHK